MIKIKSVVFVLSIRLSKSSFLRSVPLMVMVCVSASANMSLLRTAVLILRWFLF